MVCMALYGLSKVVVRGLSAVCRTLVEHIGLHGTLFGCAI